MSSEPTPPSGPYTQSSSALPPGTRLGEFELLSVLGVGGFGIVYLALDHDLEREVAVKEYMPASLAGRTETLHVSLRSQSDADTFALGLRSFVNEARLLARFDHPSLLKVHRYWEANGTAYMAMPVMRGRTVKEVRQEMATPPDEAWLRALLDPLLGAIERLHSEGVYHRDIAPDNIQIEPDGHPVLLDFGAARRVISDKSQTLTAILKPAYAPIEQYAEAGSVKQGPWTDLYALGATLHYLLLLRPPPPATARAVHDDAAPLAGMQLPGCSENFLQIVDWMLAPRPSDRPQSVAALRQVLDGRTLPPRRRAVPAQPASQWEQTVVLPPPAAARPERRDDDATMVVPRSPTQGTPPPPLTPAPPATPQPLPTGAAAAPATVPPVAAAMTSAPTRRRSMLAPMLLGVAAVGVAAAFAFWPRQAAVSAAGPVAVAPLLAAAASAPASAAESTVATVTVAPAPSSPVGPAAVSIAAPEPPRPPQGEARATVPAAAPTPPRVVVERAPRKAALSTPASAPAAFTSPGTQPQVTAQPADVAPVAVARPAPAVAAAAPRPEPAAEPKPVATGPEAKCGARNPLMYFACMERECWRSQFATHPDCLAWRKEARRRE
ncbi:MAG: protein kinase [Rubrivivax sp.]|nr:protein kinase [Rubrivivax sp.]